MNTLGKAELTASIRTNLQFQGPKYGCQKKQEEGEENFIHFTETQKTYFWS